MSFLLPFMQERETCTNLKDVSDDDNENEPNENVYNDTNNDREDVRNDRRDDQNDDRRDDGNDDREDNQNDDKDDGKDDDIVEELHAEDEKKKKQKENYRKSLATNKTKTKGNRCQTQPESASVILMKYILDKKTKSQITPNNSSTQPSAIDTFFSSIAATVKNFSPSYQNIAKSQIFSIITDLEMKQITQEQPFFGPNTPTQHQHSAQMQYHTGPYNVSRSLPSSSFTMSHFSEETAYNENTAYTEKL